MRSIKCAASMGAFSSGTPGSRLRRSAKTRSVCLANMPFRQQVEGADGAGRVALGKINDEVKQRSFVSSQRVRLIVQLLDKEKTYAGCHLLQTL
jgi:hypothetical protein